MTVDGELLLVDGRRPWCLRCRRPGSVCLCAFVTTLHPRTRFVILVHPKEARRIRNGTGRVTHLSLAGSELIEGIDFSDHPRVVELLADPALDCGLLYPGATQPFAPAPSTDRTPVLFILDGTWAFAKKMMRLSTNLHGLPRLSLEVDRPSEFRTKHQPHPGCLATIEAADRALLALAEAGVEDYGPADSDRLLRPFRRMVEMTLEHRANPGPQSYRTEPPGPPRPKGRTAVTSGRNVVFQG